MNLRLLPDTFGVLKLSPPQVFPSWLSSANIFFVAQTEDEYSVMCPERYIPPEFDYDGGWRCLRVDGDLAFDEVGVVARVSKPLSDAGLSLFLVSTHDRDYVLIAQADLERALTVYADAGFQITPLSC